MTLSVTETPTSIGDLRYPIGQFTPPSDNAAGTRAAHIETLRLLPEQMTAAVAGLNDSQLNTPYREGGWTVRQLVHHVADSHANSYIRMKLALTEEWPTIKPYDEAAWANLPDSRLPVEVSLDMLRVIHVRWVALLDSLGEDDFLRGYVHPGIRANGGLQTLDEALALYDWHSRHHTAHIQNLRQRMGW
jgi:hypothetical protein